jgi:hypothetical protein
MIAYIMKMGLCHPWEQDDYIIIGDYGNDVSMVFNVRCFEKYLMGEL